MKKILRLRSAFFNPRVFISLACCSIVVLVALLAFARQNQSSVPGLAPQTAVAEGGEYPGMGNDMTASTANVTIDITGVGSDTVDLNGYPTTINRSNPCVGCGPGGRTTIQTEMVQLNLTGSSGMFGPIMVRVAPTPSPQSLGQISQQTPGVDFPADSFFDIFVEIQTPMGVLHNRPTEPIHMQAVINALPPINSVYNSPFGGTTLVNSANQPVGSLSLASLVLVLGLDHFKAYITTGPANGDTVQLRDQFDLTAVSFTVGQPFRFANPVQKTYNCVVTPITNPETHLKIYRLLPAPGTPTPTPTATPTPRQVQVSNQFGLQTLTVQDPVLLGVPTQKNGGGAPHDTDHFKFYNATGGAIPTATPIVALLDQFHQELNVPVLQVRYFGNPVEKIHNSVVTPILNPIDHLVCYDIVPQPFTTTITTLNQFGPENLEIQPADLLCVPSKLPTPAPIFNISGAVLYCSNPVPGPVPNVTMTLTGTSANSTLTNACGYYSFTSLPSAGNYTVTPTKAARPPGSDGITTVDVLAIQRHFLGIGTPLSGCRLAAADVNGIGGINTQDVISVNRFFLGFSTGISNVGKYKFNPASRAYTGIVNNQIAQNYDTLVFGDVASPFAESVDGPSQSGAGDRTNAVEVPATVATVTLPNSTVDASVTNFIAKVTTTPISADDRLVGFQGDFTFDERVVTFQSQPVQKAGITSGNWNVSGNVLPGNGPIRTLRISAYSNDFTPLSGSGTLFELRMTQISNAAQGTQLLWATPPDDFIFIDADLKTQKPGYAASGRVTASGKGR